MANALADLLGGIAEAIREKTGHNVPLAPMNFPEEIRSISVYTGDSGSAEPGGTLVPGSGLRIATGRFSPNTGKYEMISSYETFSQDKEHKDYYSREDSFKLVSGGKYVVQFNGMQRNYTARTVAATAEVPEHIVVGNAQLLEGGSGDPYLFVYYPEAEGVEEKSIIYTSQTCEKNFVGLHRVTPTQITVEHGLGTVPDLILVYYNGFDLLGTMAAYAYQVTSVFGLHSKFAEYCDVLSCIAAYGASLELAEFGLDNMPDSEKNRGYIFCRDDNTFTLGDTTYFDTVTNKLMADQRYNWIAMTGLGSAASYPSAEEVAF